jgi:spermidine synthase
MAGSPAYGEIVTADRSGADRRRAASIVEPVDLGTAELVPDPGWPRGWTLIVDGVAQSYVDLDDPTRLEFEYVRHVAALIDLAAAPGAPIRVLHLGGGGLTIPRYVEAVRPGSAQRVIERDGALIALVRRVLPLPAGANIQLHTADAYEAVQAEREGQFDLVIADVFRAARMPRGIAGAEFAARVARLLCPGGWYLVNATDVPPWAFSRSLAATLRGVFADVGLLAAPGPLRGRRFGNVVLLAANEPGGLPMRQLAAMAVQAAGPVQAGPVQAGPVQAGPVQAGPAQAGPAQAGPAQAAVPNRRIGLPVHGSDLDRFIGTAGSAAEPYPDSLPGPADE